MTPRDLPASFWTTVVIEAAGTADSLGFADSVSVSLEASDCETGAGLLERDGDADACAADDGGGRMGHYEQLLAGHARHCNGIMERSA